MTGLVSSILTGTVLWVFLIQLLNNVIGDVVLRTDPHDVTVYPLHD